MVLSKFLRRFANKYSIVVGVVFLFLLLYTDIWHCIPLCYLANNRMCAQ